MPDGVEILSKVSGLSKDDILSIWDEVRENAKKLEGCPGPHDFQPDTSKRLNRDEVCSKCGGKISKVNANWYREGLEHRKQMDD